MSRQQPKLSPEKIGVATVPTNSLKPNPNNPRMLFDRQPMKILRESIAKVGILVPLTVYQAKGEQRYTILDGQRRWMCAQKLKLPRVPINLITEPSIVQNIVTMFQIHKLREDWELMPTALKLQVLMDKLQVRSDRKVAELTGLDQAVVSRCKKLLSYPRRYQDMMLDPDPDKRQKADFFIELYPVLSDRAVGKMDWFSRNRFTRRMLEKYHNPDSDLKAVTDFRVMKQHINRARSASQLNELSRRLKTYADDDSVSMSSLEIEEASISASARSLLRSVEKLESDLADVDVQQYYGEGAFWDALERLLVRIRSMLAAADRRPHE